MSVPLVLSLSDVCLTLENSSALITSFYERLHFDRLTVLQEFAEQEYGKRKMRKVKSNVLKKSRKIDQQLFYERKENSSQ